MSTREYLDGLTIDQLQFAHDYAMEKIAAAQASPKRIVWRVQSGILVEKNYREGDYQAAADHVARLLVSRIGDEATRLINNGPANRRLFMDDIPQLVPEFVSEIEYDTEWFPKSAKVRP